MTPVRALLVPLLAAVLVALGGCSSLSGGGGDGFVSRDGRLTTIEPADRGAPIELTGEDLDGEMVDLQDLRGQVVVVNVWGAWCGPCHAEAPDLAAAAAEAGDDTAYLGINFRDPDRAQAQAFVRNNDLRFPSIYSPDGEALLAFAGTLTQRSVPATVVLDRKGRVAASIGGALPSTQTLTDLVDDVAAEDG